MQANSSANECPDYQPTHHLHLVVYSVVLAAGLPLNALALWVFLRALRVHSVVSVYMCNLAASDLLFTLSLPLRLSYYARHYWPFPDFLCQLAGAVFQMNMYGSCVQRISVRKFSSVRCSSGIFCSSMAIASAPSISPARARPTASPILSGEHSKVTAVS